MNIYKVSFKRELTNSFFSINVDAETTQRASVYAKRIFKNFGWRIFDISKCYCPNTPYKMYRGYRIWVINNECFFLKPNGFYVQKLNCKSIKFNNIKMEINKLCIH